MKKLLFLCAVLSLFVSALTQATTMIHQDKGIRTVIGAKRVVVDYGSRHYICEIADYVAEGIDDDGLVYSSAGYVCNDKRTVFIIKMFQKTTSSQIRLYDSIKKVFLFDKILTPADYTSVGDK